MLAVVFLFPATFTGPAKAVMIGPIEDNYDYVATDPDATKWFQIVQEPVDRTKLGCTADNPCHDMWADSPGYIYSNNAACSADTTLSSYTSGCGADARMQSLNTLPYDVTANVMMRLQERFSPNIHNTLFCITFALPDIDEMMHIIGLRDRANPQGSFVRIVISHTCTATGWKFYARADYVDSGGTYRQLESWTGNVINKDDWLELTIDVMKDGQETLLHVENPTTGKGYDKFITTKLGSTSVDVEIEVQYRHNERSRTDWIDFRIFDEPTGAPRNSGGSVAYGTLITMADGTRVPVQNLDAGEAMLGYDTLTSRFTVSTITEINAVNTANMLVINTEAGLPLRVDANPAQTLWVKSSGGSVGWLSVTALKVGDYLFDEQQRWVLVTGIEFAPRGTHVMFDIIATVPYFANSYLDPPIKL
jgi:hypothetical protein